MMEPPPRLLPRVGAARRQTVDATVLCVFCIIALHEDREQRGPFCIASVHKPTANSFDVHNRRDVWVWQHCGCIRRWHTRRAYAIEYSAIPG
mmetsp:Transcript_9499/g.28093  ORF Transcript_9499/g.28093 Transcript_9499/m.28093 type:complete len:92 (-) Transcript_9499:401-676(-)